MKYFAWVFLCLGLVSPQANAERYMSQESFLKEAFGSQAIDKKKLWLTPDVKATAKKILKHDYNRLRVRYWHASEEGGDRTAWILEEIGKERPITIGVVVKGSTIEQVRILEFRESRGWEVRYPFFTDQFANVEIDDSYRLNKIIDGVSGATLSVRAVKKVAALALFFHQVATKP